MYEEFFKSLYNTLVVLNAPDELLRTLDTDVSLEQMTRKLNLWNSEKLDSIKSQVMKFKGIDIIGGTPIIRK